MKQFKSNRGFIKKSLISLYLVIGFIAMFSVNLYCMHSEFEAIQELTNKVMSNESLKVAFDTLYEAKDDLTFISCLMILLQLLKESKRDSIHYIATHLDSSKLRLFKNYSQEFAKLCDKEALSTIDKFLNDTRFFELRNFKDELEKIMNDVEESFKKNPEYMPSDLPQILAMIKKNIINTMFFPVFEEYSTKNCIIVLYKVLDLFGLDILDTTKYLSLSQIDIKKLIERNNKLMNVRLKNLAVELMYHYISAKKYKELLPLLDRLYSKGFARKDLIDHLAQAVAVFLKNNSGSSRNITLESIMPIINDYIMKSSYRFDNYKDLIERYVRTYTLMNYLQAKFKYEWEVKGLLHQGVQINALDFKGNSPLVYAIYHGNITYVTELVKKGADINLPTKDGITPLMKAILKENLPIIIYLLEQGADLEAKDIYGDDAWSFAEENQTINNLLKNAQEKTGIKPLNKPLDNLKELSFELNVLANQIF